MSFYDKIKVIAETMTGYNVLVDTSNGANVEIDSLTMPCILVQIQQSGSFNTANSHYRDSANVRIFLLNDIPQDFNNTDVDAKKEILKAAAVELYHKLRFNFDFKTNSNTLNYNVEYDLFDANLLGVIITDLLTEVVGKNLACDTVPQPQSFTVEIKDQDGNVIRTFTTSGEYVVTVLSGIQQVIGNTSTTITQDIID